MSNFTDDLKGILHYYTGSRGVGHTDLMIDGLRHSRKYPVAVLVRGMSNAGHIMNRADIRPENVIFVTPGDLQRRLRGYGLPLAVDNYMIAELCRASLDEIDRAAEHWQRMYFAQQKEFAQRLESSQERASHWERRAIAIEGRWINKAWDWTASLARKAKLWPKSKQ